MGGADDFVLLGDDDGDRAGVAGERGDVVVFVAEDEAGGEPREFLVRDFLHTGERHDERDAGDALRECVDDCAGDAAADAFAEDEKRARVGGEQFLDGGFSSGCE